MCTDEKLSDKVLFPTFARTVPPVSRLSPPLQALMKHFKWTRIGIIAQTNQRWSQWSTLERDLRSGGLVVGIARTLMLGVHFNTSGLLPEFENLLQRVAQDSRSKFNVCIEY